MNPEFPQNERAVREAKLTALLLGELHADEVAELSRAMENDPDLAALYERLKVTIDLVREGTMQPKAEEAPRKLSAEKREKLLASFKTVTPKEFVRPQGFSERLVPWAAAAVIVFFIGALAMPNFIKTRETSKKNTIVNNLRLLDGAKQQWALENNKPADAEPTMADIGPYIGRGGTVTEMGSVAGEKYVLGKMSELPKVETSVAQAKKLFGREVAARGEAREGKVAVSPLEGLNAAGQTALVPGYKSEFTAPNEVAMAPIAAPTESAGDRQIVLPQQPDAGAGVVPGQTLAGTRNLQVAHLENADPTTVLPALKQLADQPTNLWAFNSAVFGGRRQPETISPGATYLTNGVSGPVVVDLDSHNLVISADKTTSEATKDAIARKAQQIPDAAGGPVVADAGNSILTNSVLHDPDWIGVLETPTEMRQATSSIVISTLSSESLSKYVDTNVQWNLGAGSANGQALADNSTFYRIPTPSATGSAADTTKWAGTIETHNKVGALNEKIDTEKLRGALGTGQVALAVTDGADGKVPIFGDVPALGSAFRSTSTVAHASDSFQTGFTRDDVGGLRYTGTNGVVASQPLADNWAKNDSEYRRNDPVLLYSYSDGPLIANSNSEEITINGSLLSMEEPASHSAGAVQDAAARKGGIVLPAADQSVLIARSSQAATGSPASIPRSGISSFGGTGGFGGGGGGGGGGGFRGGVAPAPSKPAAGGKQVELAAAAAASSTGNRIVGYDNPGPFVPQQMPALSPTPPDDNLLDTGAVTTMTGVETSPRFVKVVTNDTKALGFDWYVGNFTNGSVVASGGTTPATDPRLIEAQRGKLPSAQGLERAKQTHEGNAETSQLVQDGKLLYQLGKTDEAEIKMNETLNRDPGNQAALYYLSLIKQQRIREVVDARNVTSMNRMVQVEKGWADDSARKQLPVSSARTNFISSNSWWNASATNRGFYDDNLNSAAAGANSPSNNIYSANVVGFVSVTGKVAEYAAAKEQLDEAKRWRQVLAMKTGQMKVDASLPKARMVTITDPAVPPQQDELTLGAKIKKAFTGKVGSTTKIQVDEEKPDLGGIGTMGNLGSGYDPYFLQTEFEAIRSDAVLGKVVENLKLDGGDKSKTQEAIKQLRKNLDLQSVKNTKVIEINAKSAKPEDAARIANSVAEAYRDYRNHEFNDLMNSGIDSLKTQLDEQDAKIAALQSNVDRLGKDRVVGDPLAKVHGGSDDSNMLSSELAQLKTQSDRDASLLANLKAMDRDALRKALPIANNDGQLNELMSELNLAQQKLISLRGDYNPDHPKYKNAQAAVDDLNHKVDDRVDAILHDLERKVEVEKANVDAFAKALNVSEAVKGATTAAAQQNDNALPKPAVPPPTPQPEILTKENAVSTFSLNVSDVSFKLAAASLEKGQMPEPASIRSEEFINAFDYRDPDARDGAAVAFAAERARYPFAHNRELLRFSLKTAAAGRQAGRPLNIVLLLDNSGSMERADRVRIIQEALRVLAGQLQASDTFSIVTFARTAQLRVDGIPGNQAGAAAEEIAKLTPEGGTNLGDALELAYQTALHHYLANGDNRVVLLTDGAANLGDVQPEVLKRKVEAHRQQGVALDCFGIGWEGFNDDLLEVLTRNGDGRYGFINTPEEATTEFVAQIAGALHVAASDVKVQVEFNPKRVTSYRQMGYAKHQLTKEQFRDNTVDAAEIAAQEAGNALYTIETDPQGEGSIATVRVRYKVPGTVEYREQAWDVPYTGGAVAFDQASPAMRLAGTASAFSEWLSTSPFAAEVSTERLLNYLSGVPQVYGADARPAKLEWMIRQARSISGK